jgi:hypothetical protein
MSLAELYLLVYSLNNLYGTQIMKAKPEIENKIISSQLALHCALRLMRCVKKIIFIE